MIWSCLEAPVNLCQLESLNYLRLNPNLIEQILALFHVKSRSLTWYTPLFMSMPKAITAALSKANYFFSRDAEPCERSI